MESAGLLIAIAIAAFALPLIARGVGVPAVVLEILFGILIGPSVTGFVARSEIFDLLAELGFFLLMFLSGFEIDFSRLAREGIGGTATALFVFATTLFLAYVGARLLGFGFFMMFVLATTSVGIVVPTIRSLRLETSNLGQATLVSAVLADFLTLLGVTVFALIHDHGVGPRLGAIPGFFLLVAAALLALRRAAWWMPERFQQLFGAEDTEELGIRASLALMFGFVGLSQLFGIEPILGAFIAGSVFALVFRHRGALDQKLTGFAYGFFIPIFFINVGLRFDLRSLLSPEIGLSMLALLGVAVAVKLLPALLLTARGLSLREALAAGTLLSARLSLIIAVAELGVALRIIGDVVESSIILLALVTTTLAPTLFRRVYPPPPVRARREPAIS